MAALFYNFFLNELDYFLRVKPDTSDLCRVVGIVIT